MRRQYLLVLATLAWVAPLGARQQANSTKPAASPCPNHRAHAAVTAQRSKAAPLFSSIESSPSIGLYFDFGRRSAVLAP